MNPQSFPHASMFINDLWCFKGQFNVASMLCCRLREGDGSGFEDVENYTPGFGQ